MNKKFYTSPEIEIDKFLLDSVIFTQSSKDTSLEDNGGDFTGGENWEF